MKQIMSLQAGRGIAALAVVLHHATLSTTAFVDAVPPPLAGALTYGYLGVDFFFVLSGFIIYFTAARLDPSVPAARRFMWQRLTRVFVPYLPIAVALAVAYALLPDLSDGHRNWGWLETLTLWPGTAPPALSVAWTLQHEMLFYALFATLFLARQVGSGMAIWAVAIMVAWLSKSVMQPGPLRFALAPINLEFGMGVAAASLFMSGRQVPKRILLSIAILALSAFCWLGGERDLSMLVGLSVAAGVLLLCHAEGAGHLKVPGALVLLGGASYAIYLIHNPLLSLTSRVAASPPFASWKTSFAIGIAASVAAGVLYHRLFEMPALGVIRRMGTRSRTVPDRAETQTP